MSTLSLRPCHCLVTPPQAMFRVLSPDSPDAKEKNSTMLALNVFLLGSRYGG